MANISAKEIMYQSVVYEKPEVIQGLMRFYYDFKNRAQGDFTEELICIYVDIDKALNTVDITDRQREAMNYYMEGWTEEEIGKLMGGHSPKTVTDSDDIKELDGGITHQAVHKLVMKVCCKVSDYLKDGDT